MSGPKHDTTNFFLQSRNQPLIVAHRGINNQAPENTLAAFRLAHIYHADAVELDVQLTTDGRVIVFHDGRLNRMTNGQGPVGQKTWAELKQLKITNGTNWQASKQRIPLLSEVLATISPDIPIQIELKSFYGGGRRQLLARNINQLITAANCTQQVMIKSFDPYALLAIQKINPALTFGLLLLPRLSLMRFVGAWRQAFQICQIIEPGRITLSMVRRLHRQGKRVITWTIDNPKRAAHYRAWNVDGIITNDTASLSDPSAT